MRPSTLTWKHLINLASRPADRPIEATETSPLVKFAEALYGPLAPWERGLLTMLARERRFNRNVNAIIPPSPERKPLKPGLYYGDKYLGPIPPGLSGGAGFLRSRDDERAMPLRPGERWADPIC